MAQNKRLMATNSHSETDPQPTSTYPSSGGVKQKQAAPRRCLVVSSHTHNDEGSITDGHSCYRTHQLT